MKRLVTAAVLIPVFLYIMLWAPNAVFSAALALVALVSYWELDGIIAAHGILRPGIPGAFAGLALLFAPVNVALAVFVALAALAYAMRCVDLRQALPAAGAFVLAVLYVFGSWRCAAALRSVQPALLFFAVALNWAGDTAALYVGRAFGRRKLAPRISPGKSWEGAIASVAASALFGLLYFEWALPHEVPLGWAAVLSVAGNIAGQLGDLAESALKRGAGLKDSGTLLPGHGGWLDRVDSALFAVPVVYALMIAWSGRVNPGNSYRQLEFRDGILSHALAQPPSATRSREHTHSARGRQRVSASGDALLDRQGLLGHAPACAKGLLPGPDSVPAATYRHNL